MSSLNVLRHVLAVHHAASAKLVGSWPIGSWMNSHDCWRRACPNHQSLFVGRFCWREQILQRMQTAVFDMQFCQRTQIIRYRQKCSNTSRVRRTPVNYSSLTAVEKVLPDQSLVGSKFCVDFDRRSTSHQVLSVVVIYQYFFNEAAFQ